MTRSLFGPLVSGDLFEPFDGDLVPDLETFVPPIDVFHDDRAVTIRVEVPGVRKEDLDVHIEGRVLTVSGRKEHVPSSGYHEIESRCGSFRRSITLGHAVDTGKATAMCADGVLTITMPLTDEAKPKQIPIEIK